MIHKIVATVLIVHSRHTGSSTPATTGTNILAGVVIVTILVVVMRRFVEDTLSFTESVSSGFKIV